MGISIKLIIIFILIYLFMLVGIYFILKILLLEEKVYIILIMIFSSLLILYYYLSRRYFYLTNLSSLKINYKFNKFYFLKLFYLVSIITFNFLFIFKEDKLVK